MNNTFEIGDIVEILDSQCSGLGVGTHHKIGRITKLDIQIKDTNGTTWYFEPDGSTLKLISKGSNMKEIIGYNIKPEFSSKTEAIDNALGVKFHINLGHYMDNDSLAATRAKELGVLDIWFEPVYKATEVVVQLSKNRTATITSKSEATITANSEGKFTVQAVSVHNTYDAFNKLGQIAGYNVGVKEFNLGCQTFTIKDLELVHQAFIDFK